MPEVGHCGQFYIPYSPRMFDLAFEFSHKIGIAIRIKICAPFGCFLENNFFVTRPNSRCSGIPRLAVLSISESCICKERNHSSVPCTAPAPPPCTAPAPPINLCNLSLTAAPTSSTPHCHQFHCLFVLGFLLLFSGTFPNCVDDS